MRIVTFAEDNPQASTFFLLLFQGFANAAPGARAPRVLAVECQILQKLEAISTPSSDSRPDGFLPRRLTEPCAVAFTNEEHALLLSYLSKASFAPYLSATLLALLDALFHAPETGTE